MQQFLEDRFVSQEESGEGEVPGVSGEGLYKIGDFGHIGALEGNEGGLFGCYWSVSAVS
jgi:hypothetical protein